MGVSKAACLSGIENQDQGRCSGTLSASHSCPGSTKRGVHVQYSDLCWLPLSTAVLYNTEYAVGLSHGSREKGNADVLAVRIRHTQVQPIPLSRQSESGSRPYRRAITSLLSMSGYLHRQLLMGLTEPPAPPT